MYRKGFKIVSPDMGVVGSVVGGVAGAVAGILSTARCASKLRTIDSAFGIKFIREKTSSMSQLDYLSVI